METPTLIGRRLFVDFTLPYLLYIDKILMFKIFTMKTIQFTVYIEQDEDGMFVGSIPAVPSCHAEGKTQAGMMKNLEEVLELCLRNVNRKEVMRTKFIGIQNLELSNA